MLYIERETDREREREREREGDVQSPIEKAEPGSQWMGGERER